MSNKQLTISVPVFITITVDSDNLKNHKEEILANMTNSVQRCIDAWEHGRSADDDEDDNDDIGTTIQAGLSHIDITVHEVAAVDATVECETDVD